MIDHVLAFLAGGLLAWVFGYTLGVWVYEKVSHSHIITQAMAGIDDEIREFLGEH